MARPDYSLAPSPESRGTLSRPGTMAPVQKDPFAAYALGAGGTALVGASMGLPLLGTALTGFGLGVTGRKVATGEDLDWTDVLNVLGPLGGMAVGQALKRGMAAVANAKNAAAARRATVELDKALTKAVQGADDAAVVTAKQAEAAVMGRAGIDPMRAGADPMSSSLAAARTQTRANTRTIADPVTRADTRTIADPVTRVDTKTIADPATQVDPFGLSGRGPTLRDRFDVEAPFGRTPTLRDRSAAPKTRADTRTIADPVTRVDTKTIPDRFYDPTPSSFVSARSPQPSTRMDRPYPSPTQINVPRSPSDAVRRGWRVPSSAPKVPNEEAAGRLLPHHPNMDQTAAFTPSPGLLAQANPRRGATAILPRAAEKNRSFFTGGMSPRFKKQLTATAVGTGLTAGALKGLKGLEPGPSDFTPAVDAPSRGSAPMPGPSGAATGRYQIKPGDTLMDIVDQLAGPKGDKAQLMNDILLLNPEVLKLGERESSAGPGAGLWNWKDVDPSKVKAGATLHLPTQEQAATLKAKEDIMSATRGKRQKQWQGTRDNNQKSAPSVGPVAAMINKTEKPALTTEFYGDDPWVPEPLEDAPDRHPRSTFPTPMMQGGRVPGYWVGGLISAGVQKATGPIFETLAKGAVRRRHAVKDITENWVNRPTDLAFMQRDPATGGRKRAFIDPWHWKATDPEQFRKREDPLSLDADMGYYRGGFVDRRPASTDTTLALLTPGEHVIDKPNADYVRRNPGDITNLQRLARDIRRGRPSTPPGRRG